MMCQACEEGLHYLCGMQTWCECDCDGEEFGPSPDDDMPHSNTCTCEHCAQTYPERLAESWDDEDYRAEEYDAEPDYPDGDE